MRPIEFRAQRADTREWVYGYLAEKDVINIPIHDETTGYHGYDDVLILSETVGQFTGRLDANGKKIFEGDRVRVQGGRKPRGQARPFYETEIVFKGNMFTLKDNFTIFHDYAAINRSEVIGTIHDKPEKP